MRSDRAWTANQRAAGHRNLIVRKYLRRGRQKRAVPTASRTATTVPSGNGYGTECDSMVTDGSCVQTCTAGYSGSDGGSYSCPSGAFTGSLLSCTVHVDTVPHRDWYMLPTQLGQLLVSAQRATPTAA